MAPESPGRAFRCRRARRRGQPLWQAPRSDPFRISLPAPMARAALLAVLLARVAAAAPFTPGSFLGDAASPFTAANAAINATLPVYLDVWAYAPPAAPTLLQTIALPTAASGANFPRTLYPGNSASDASGGLSPSRSGRASRRTAPCAPRSASATPTRAPARRYSRRCWMTSRRRSAGTPPARPSPPRAACARSSWAPRRPPPSPPAAPTARSSPMAASSTRPTRQPPTPTRG